MSIFLLIVSFVMLLLVMYNDNWLWRESKVRSMICWAVIGTFGVIPVMIDPVLGCVSIPFMMLQVYHSKKLRDV